jgi:surface antigen
MAMHTKPILTLIAAAALLAACSGQGQKQTGGAIIGGVGGAVLGAQVGDGTGQLVATAAGALLGAWIGSEIGASLDRADRQMAEQSAQRSLEDNRDGQAGNWDNPNTGHGGYTTPTRTYESAGSYCREYETAVVIDGRTETATGTACRQPDGTWRVVN